MSMHFSWWPCVVERCTSKLAACIRRNMRERAESANVSARIDEKTTVRTTSTKRCDEYRRSISSRTCCEMSCGSRS